MAEANVEGAVAAFAQSVLRALGEVEGALAADGYLALQETALAISAEEALAARRLAEDRYQRGLSDLITMLESQRRAFEAQSRYIAVRRQRLDNRLDLHLALGGGFEHSLSSNSEPHDIQGSKVQ
jgi:outer membrane protein TolC